MRKWSCLAKPYKDNGMTIQKVMICQTESEGTYVFLYRSIESQISIADEWYETLEKALEKWTPLIAPCNWTSIDDPMPGCQQDSFSPIRVKGRNTGNPEWGKLEILDHDKWISYAE